MLRALCATRSPRTALGQPAPESSRSIALEATERAFTSFAAPQVI